MGAPALLEDQAQQVLDRLNAITTHLNNSVRNGLLVSDGGTTQASGASTAPNVDLDVAAGLVTIDGTAYDIAAAADVDSDGGAGVDFGATSGKSVQGVLVVYDNAGTPTWMVVFGDVADTGEEAAPSSDDIDTAVSDNPWVAVAGINLERTGDTAITLTIDHTYQLDEDYMTGDGILGLEELDATGP